MHGYINCFLREIKQIIERTHSSVQYTVQAFNTISSLASKSRGRETIFKNLSQTEGGVMMYGGGRNCKLILYSQRRANLNLLEANSK